MEKMLIVENSESEEALFKQTVKWLSSKFNNIPSLIKQEITEFHIDCYTRTFINEEWKSLVLNSKRI